MCDLRAATSAKMTLQWTQLWPKKKMRKKGLLLNIFSNALFSFYNRCQSHVLLLLSFNLYLTPFFFSAKPSTRRTNWRLWKHGTSICWPWRPRTLLYLNITSTTCRIWLTWVSDCESTAGNCRCMKGTVLWVALFAFSASTVTNYSPD